MTNRINKKFKELKSQRQKALIAFITAGDPSLTKTKELVLGFEKAGIDIVELGIPFSDPMADGPTIQASSQRALDRGTTLTKIIALTERLRKKTQIPITFMMYYNHIFHYGEERFVKKIKKVGVDGLIVPDLPVEEAKSLIKLCQKHDISLIPFISPTTSEARIKKIAKQASGFIYYVSVAGVTGARSSVGDSYVKQIKRTRKYTKTPVCVGFGISTPQQAKKIARNADGVIVGSAIINQIQKHSKNKTMVAKVSGFVKTLVQVLH